MRTLSSPCRVWLYIRTILPPDPAAQLEAAFAGVVRALGLLRPDTTPCGQPMSVTEAHAIGELHVSGPLTQQELCARLRLEKSTVSRLVDQLGNRGIVARKPNPDDGRSVHVTLTAKGRRLTGRLRAARSQLFADLVADMSPEDQALVLGGLTRLEAAAHARQ